MHDPAYRNKKRKQQGQFTVHSLSHPNNSLINDVQRTAGLLFQVNVRIFFVPVFWMLTRERIVGDEGQTIRNRRTSALSSLFSICHIFLFHLHRSVQGNYGSTSYPPLALDWVSLC